MSSPAAVAAARAGGQAASVAHMGAHALGAAAYAAKAAGLAAPDQPTAVSDEISWQLAHMNAQVRAALQQLPPLGELRGPARFRTSRVGRPWVGHSEDSGRYGHYVARRGRPVSGTFGGTHCGAGGGSPKSGGSCAERQKLSKVLIRFDVADVLAVLHIYRESPANYRL